jgi:hypothetical protein
MATLGTEARMDDVRRAAAVIEQVEGDPERRRRAWTPGVRRALIVVSVFFIFQQITGVLVCFAALCALAIVFIWKFLPETKGLPVEEIVKIFERNQGSAGTAPAEHASR